MNRQEILDRLRENETALKARGVMHAALFGSRARGEERPDSDIDIMIDIDPGAYRRVGKTPDSSAALLVFSRGWSMGLIVEA